MLTVVGGLVTLGFVAVLVVGFVAGSITRYRNEPKVMKEDAQVVVFLGGLVGLLLLVATRC